MDTKQELKIRVLKAKNNLPKSGLTNLFFHYFKSIKKNNKNKVKLTNVLQARISDKDFTEKLEELVELLIRDNDSKTINN